MRLGVGALVCAFDLALAPARAEKRVFIIASHADGYGIDRCLAAGAACGTAAATAFCQAREFSEAASFRKIEGDEITGAAPAPAGCRKAGCGELVAIECAR
jgi:hypothetical protein